jgi:cell division septum initiation protein DivIVA
MTAMCKHWFANPDGSLKTFRISLVVFLMVLVGLGVIREAARSKDTLLVRVSHVFEPEAVQKEPEAEQQVPAPEFREKVEKQIPEKPDSVEKVEKQEAKEKQISEEKQKLAEDMVTQAPEKTESAMAAVVEKPDDIAKQTDPFAALVKPASLEPPADADPGEPDTGNPVESVKDVVQPVMQADAMMKQEAITVEDIRPVNTMQELDGQVDAVFAEIVQEDIGLAAEKTREQEQQINNLTETVPEETVPEETVPETTGQAEQVAQQAQPGKKAQPEKIKRISLAQDMEKWLRKNRSDSGRDPESPAGKREPADLRVSLPGAEGAEPARNAIELASEEYAALYQQWRRSGDHLESDSQGIALRIMDLETVYDLFQMKVVAFRGQTPYMDLADNTRVAPQSLDGYSGTCFVVSRPWEKWGDALSRAGFRKNEAVEVRYYTYQFVRNAIFARAARAVAWSAAAGPGTEADLSSADVLGRVYGVNRSGGGAFGVFVPVRVDFASGPSVAVDPLACFPNEPDILALNRAGLL